VSDRGSKHMFRPLGVWRKAWERRCGLVGAAGIVAQRGIGTRRTSFADRLAV